jgi:hypothetical protein
LSKRIRTAGFEPRKSRGPSVIKTEPRFERGSSYPAALKRARARNKKAVTKRVSKKRLIQPPERPISWASVTRYCPGRDGRSFSLEKSY